MIQKIALSFDTMTNLITNKEQISNIDVVVFALFLLDGVKKKVHTEEIAVRCHALAPDKFSWHLEKYKHFPDRQATFWALQDARKAKSGRLVEGRGGRDAYGEREGWHLTPEGVKWLIKNEQRIAKALEQKRPQMRQLDKGRFLKKLRREDAFMAYIKDGNLENVSRYNFTDFLNCPPDADIATIEKKFEAIKAKAVLITDDELDGFLALCEQKFKELIKST